MAAHRWRTEITFEGRWPNRSQKPPHSTARRLAASCMAIALAVIAVSCGSPDLPEVTLVGVDEQRSQEALAVVQVGSDCEQPLRIKKVTAANRVQYEVTCLKDGFIFDAERTHTVFCADGEWHKVGYSAVGTVGISCTASER